MSFVLFHMRLFVTGIKKNSLCFIIGSVRFTIMKGDYGFGSFSCTLHSFYKIGLTINKRHTFLLSADLSWLAIQSRLFKAQYNICCQSEKSVLSSDICGHSDHSLKCVCTEEISNKLTSPSLSSFPCSTDVITHASDLTFYVPKTKIY